MPRHGHTATLLPDGRVLVTGGAGDGDGVDQSSAQLYDPASGSWAVTGRMTEAHYGHTATLLPDGRVLVAGGSGDLGQLLSSAELYDPDTGSWTATGRMDEGRGNHTSTLLPDGTVLVAGGAIDLDGEAVVASAELYDPANGRWTSTAPMSKPRSSHTAVPLPDGRVLVVGGVGPFVSPVDPVALASAELYDPGRRRWSATARLSKARFGHTATLLESGQVLVAGGSGGFGVPLASAQLYDPDTGSWSATKSMKRARYDQTATRLSDGTVLVAGGLDERDAIVSPELYDPGSGRWTATAGMTRKRDNFTATLLLDGTVLVAGGYFAETSAELYDPGSGT